MPIRSEVMKQILSDAEEAKPIDGTKNVYAPEDYVKIKNRQDLMTKLDEAGDDGYLEPRIGEGEVEFDERGNLKRVARMQPKLIDPRRLTANRYLKEVVKVGTAGKRGGTHILFAFGGAVVRAFENMTLTPQVKVYRFFFDPRQKDWLYQGAELIEDKRAYSEMTNTLNGASALALIHKIEQDQVRSGEVEGDDLMDILTKPELDPEPEAEAETTQAPEGDSLDDAAKS